MSLIYVGIPDGDADDQVESLNHVVEVSSPLWTHARWAEGTVQVDFLFNLVSQSCDRVTLAVPYGPEDIDEVCLTPQEDFFRQTEVTWDSESILHYSGDEYSVVRADHCDDIRTTAVDHPAGTYTALEIHTKGPLPPGRYAVGLRFQVETLAVNVATSLLLEATWNLDITLYGPINPRGHDFLEEDSIQDYIMEVNSAYSYVFLPGKSFPRLISPEPLESFYDEASSKYFYTWVGGRLDPWYEQRMLVTYSSYGRNALFALLLGTAAGLIAYLIPTLLV